MDCQLCSRGIFVAPPVVNENQPSAVVRLAGCPRQYCVFAGSRLSTNTTSLELHELNFNFLEPTMWQCCLPMFGIQLVNFHAHVFDVSFIHFLSTSRAMDATGGEPQAKRRKVGISFNNTTKHFYISKGSSDQDNRSSIASAFKVLSTDLEVVDHMGVNMTLTFDGLDANAEYKISTATTLQAEADSFLVPHHFQFASSMCSFHLTSCFIFHIVQGYCLRR